MTSLFLTIVKYSKKNIQAENNPIYGEPMLSQKINLGRVGHTIIPFRSQVRFRTVNVPLTPFKSPYIQHNNDQVFPRFCMYNVLSEIKEQGECGSCFAFAVASMLADRISIRTRGRVSVYPSVQTLLECFDRDGCNGGSPEDVCVWMETNSVPFEQEFPYEQADGSKLTTPCPLPVSVPDEVPMVRTQHIRSIVRFLESDQEINSPKHQQNIKNMISELILYGPFFCAIAVYDDLFSYDGTRPYRPDPASNLYGGHAIEIVGYCLKHEDPRPGYSDPYWICKNSWGDWPQSVSKKGLFTIPMGENICGIESRCGRAQPVWDASLFENLGNSKNETYHWRSTTFMDYIKDQ